MSMNIIRLTTHASAEQAAGLIDFLDILRDALCETYAEQIAQMHREHCSDCTIERDQCEFDFDDELNF